MAAESALRPRESEAALGKPAGPLRPGAAGTPRAPEASAAREGAETVSAGAPAEARPLPEAHPPRRSGDSASEAAVRAALRRAVIGSGRTVLTVAHRLATAQEADRVLVMDAGQIVEVGTPEELIRRGGRFAALLELEAAGWDWQTDGRPFRP